MQLYFYFSIDCLSLIHAHSEVFLKEYQSTLRRALKITVDHAGDDELTVTVEELGLLLVDVYFRGCLVVAQLAAPDRIYMRHDMITLPSRKDQQYCLWLFNDLVVFSCIKRKTGSVNRRTSILLWVLPLWIDFFLGWPLTRWKRTSRSESCDACSFVCPHHFGELRRSATPEE